MDGSTKAGDDDPDPDPVKQRQGYSPHDGFEVGDRQEGASLPAPPSPRTTAESAEAARREKGRVRFNSAAGAAARPGAPAQVSGPAPRPALATIQLPHEGPIAKPRPSALRSSSYNSATSPSPGAEPVEPTPEKAISAAKAQERARQVAAKVHRRSPTLDSRLSLESFDDAFASDGELLLPSGSNIPLQPLAASSRPSTPEYPQQGTPEDEKQRQGLKKTAYDLVRAHTQRFSPRSDNATSSGQGHRDAHHVTPSEVNDGLYDGVYDVPPPEHYRGSVLSQLLKLYKPAPPAPPAPQHHRRYSSTSSVGDMKTPGSDSGGGTPSRRKWYEQNRSQDTLVNLIEASARLANPNTSAEQSSAGRKRPAHKRNGSQSRLSAMFQKEEEIGITVHIAETLARQDYIIKLCRALMLYGAPTHRLEEYLGMSARILEIDGQFLYLPGCMVISFDDKTTHTTEVSMVRTVQGIDLGKLKDVHHVYKEVMHDVIGVGDGTARLDKIMGARDKFGPWLRVLVFGLTSATAAPFSFHARLIDLPLCFCLGGMVGLLQILIAPRSKLYSNVFEVSATVLVSFLARAFGSIAGGSIFCFSALAQGGIVMLLPGYAVCKFFFPFYHFRPLKSRYGVAD